jgi:hypothetical protein
MSVKLLDDRSEIIITQSAHKTVFKLEQKWNDFGNWLVNRFTDRLERLEDPDASRVDEDDESMSVLEFSLDLAESEPVVEAKDASIVSSSSSQKSKNRSTDFISTPKRSARIQEKIRASIAVNGMNETKFMTPEAKIPNGRMSPVSTCSMASASKSIASSTASGRIPHQHTSNEVLQSVPSKLRAPSSSTRSQRHIPRLLKPPSTSAKAGSAVKQAPSSAMKILTASALKKKNEREAERVALQQQLREKEEKALHQKQQFLENKVLEHKTKREEKERKVAMTREQMEKEATERRLRESAKKTAKEKKLRELEEVRKLMQKKAEEKEIQDKKAAEEAARRAEEEERNRREQMEASEIRNKIAQLQHSKMSTSFLQHKAMTNSFMMKQQSCQQPTSNVHQSLMSEIDDSIQVVKEKPSAKTVVKDEHNSTFVKEKSEQPPPKPVLNSYDITDLKSDGESDDERRPKNPVPEWARGDPFIQALNSQFAKQKKNREKDVLKIFRVCPTTVDLEVIFKKYTRSVVPRYEKRTSSACWSSPPSNKLLNMSSSFWANASFAPNMDTSVYLE